MVCMAGGCLNGFTGFKTLSLHWLLFLVSLHIVLGSFPLHKPSPNDLFSRLGDCLIVDPRALRSVGTETPGLYKTSSCWSIQMIPDLGETVPHRSESWRCDHPSFTDTVDHYGVAWGRLMYRELAQQAEVSGASCQDKIEDTLWNLSFSSMVINFLGFVCHVSHSSKQHLGHISILKIDHFLKLKCNQACMVTLPGSPWWESSSPILEGAYWLSTKMTEVKWGPGHEKEEAEVGISGWLGMSLQAQGVNMPEQLSLGQTTEEFSTMPDSSKQ